MEFLLQYPEIIYGISVCLCTFVILKYFISKPTSTQKIITLLSSGVILGIIFAFITECRWPLMILAFFSSLGLYELIIKQIMRRMKIDYSGKINIDK